MINSIMKTVLILISLQLASSLAGADVKHAMSIDDQLRLKRITDTTMTPDGNSVLYTVRFLNWGENDFDTEHFLYRVDDQSTHQFIGKDGGEEFQFSPDGKLLAMLRESGAGGDQSDEDQNEASQIYVMHTEGGEAIQVTSHRGGVSNFKWKANSKGFIFLADDMRTEKAEEEYDMGDDSYFVDIAPNGKHFARYSNFWSIDLSQTDETQLSELKLVIGDFDISPDGQKIVFDARPDSRTNHPGDAELYVFNLAEDKLIQLTKNQAPESNAMWSPDGQSIAYRAPDDKTFELRTGYFWIMNLESRKSHRLDGQMTGELSTEPVWSANGQHLIFTEIHGTNTNLYQIDVESGKAQALTQVTGTLRAHGFSNDGTRMVYSFQDFTTPADLFISDLNAVETQQITNLNPWVKNSLTLSDGQLLNWTSKGGMSIEGVYYPTLNDSDKSPPLIVHVHGGPSGVIENAFRADFQILAGLGFSILAPNYRGSTGYGDKLLTGLIGEVGDGEFIDIMTGVDHTIAEKGVDPDRLGIRGWSWGGVSTSYVITQTDRFKAASIGAMVGNWAAETGPGFNFDVSLWYIGGTPWDNPEEWRKRSSMSHVKNVVTPSIIFHGGKDETSSVGQSLMFYTALRNIGKAPVRYMNFPREQHGFDEPRHIRRQQTEEISWLKKYVVGQDWQADQPDFDHQ